MSDQSKDHTSICEVLSCGGQATTTRWVITEDHGKRQLRVCWKHEEGEIDREMIPAST